MKTKLILLSIIIATILSVASFLLIQAGVHWQWMKSDSKQKIVNKWQIADSLIQILKKSSDEFSSLEVKYLALQQIKETVADAQQFQIQTRSQWVKSNGFILYSISLFPMLFYFVLILIILLTFHRKQFSINEILKLSVRNHWIVLYTVLFASLTIWWVIRLYNNWPYL